MRCSLLYSHSRNGLTQVDDVDAIVVPVGGGGLIAGNVTALQQTGM